MTSPHGPRRVEPVDGRLVLMPLWWLWRQYAPASGRSWRQEAEWLWQKRPWRMEELRGSLGRLGVEQPIEVLADEGIVHDGHHRLAVLRNGSAVVPVRFVRRVP